MFNLRFLKISLIFILSFVFGHTLYAQNSVNVDTIQVQDSYENVFVKKLNSDKNASTFLIFIKKEVKLHKHVTHSETIYVLEGKGVMLLGDKKMEVKKGDVLFIPEYTPHSVQVTSTVPLKVLSIQAPEFDGTDRVYIEK